MARKIYILFFSILYISVSGQDRYVVQLTDKNDSPYFITNPSSYLSAGLYLAWLEDNNGNIQSVRFIKE